MVGLDLLCMLNWLAKDRWFPEPKKRSILIFDYRTGPSFSFFFIIMSYLLTGHFSPSSVAGAGDTFGFVELKNRGFAF